MLQLPSDSTDAPRTFLGVTSSALGRPWLDRMNAAVASEALHIRQAHEVSDVLARVLASRGVAAAQVPGHLAPKLRDLLPDPGILTDMTPLVKRLVEAVGRRERVAIFGDYDVDGACSAALLSGYLEACGVPTRIHIPDRITEGYGPNIPAIEMLAGEGARLLVTVDCGIASHGPFARAQELGLDVLVLDHHQAPSVLPPALALVNPNRQDDLSGLGTLCAAGVTFVALVALNRALRAAGLLPQPAPDLLEMLDLVALATVADVVPLTGLNRALVRQGLIVMRERRRPGLTALIDQAGLREAPRAWHLGFLVGPRINAGGRIGDAALGARLLTTGDADEAGRIAAELDRLNRERQVVEQAAVMEAEAMALGMTEASVIVVGSVGWHPGVVGLVASRLKERYRRPAFALAFDEAGSGTGSGRSIAGVDLGRAVRRLVDEGLLVKGGGHAMAAGVTLAAGMMPVFADAIRALLAEEVGDALRAGDGLLIDAAITAQGATPELVAELETAGPFGSGMAEPVFAFPAHRLTEVSVIGNGHVRVRLKSGDGASIGGIAFRCAEGPLGQALQRLRGEMVHVAGTLGVDRWGGTERVDLRLMDVAPAIAPRA
jgi:single-stranded-DNA-specific exonuclease